ncbi:Mitochondrial distribution/morphology family 35/apoptosis [Metarhizium rileyi]|uniref:Mitochondrial distribution/morphology family 35/apoptosis n=1 Tax=Metarhizium rileyi (strain RCEF 4871) TaxID=1649241 RepID=A0A162LVF9_METRR|nr:Mitochondrial distribution/morphology family 35/apoptosis [Metarhizium rileyi RCEF 4871]
MSASLAPECNEVKEYAYPRRKPRLDEHPQADRNSHRRYDTCFLKWYSEKYLRGAEKDNKECADLFRQYQKCLGVSLCQRVFKPPFSMVNRVYLLQVALKDRGIDKLLDDAREDNKENDTRLMTPKSKVVLFGR